MLSNGLKILISISFLSFNVFAEDFGIAMPDQIKGEESEYNKEAENLDKDTSNLIMDAGEEYDFSNIKSDEVNFSLPSSGEERVKKLSEKEKILSTGNEVPFQFENRENIISSKNADIYREVYNKGASGFGFTYIKDEYDVKDGSDLYRRSFEEATGSKKAGSLHFTFDRYLSRGVISTLWGFGAGVGYAQGKGLFKTSVGQESSAKFQLYTVPLDLRLGFELEPTRFFKIGLSAGPSVMGLLQSRSDKDSGEEGKHRRQVSYGYYGNGKLQVSLNSMFDDLSFKTFSQGNVTNMFLNIEARVQSFENFQDDISITGTSLGVGFSFEYL